MKFKLLLIHFLLITSYTVAQTGPYSRVKFRATQAEMIRVLSHGIDVENFVIENGFIIAELSQEEFTIIKNENLQFEVIHNNVSDYYAERALTDQQKSNLVPPPGFEYGSLGSYLTYTEMVEMLDSIHRRYPHLISEKEIIGYTLEGREMYVVKISDNPDKNESHEKQVLYDAMHHAREPQGMMQLMYFMWYIMDRYENNDLVAKYIINNRELYFVPIVNPDGYVYNELIEPNGGGMWRKNRSSNSDGSRGVDLNRNYGYDWGYDDIGSSPFGSSNTFRGVSAFSEPETQNMRDFVNTKKFKSNLSYHTFGGYLIYPFGAKENYYTPDSNLFRLYADSLTKDNGYFAGTVFETLSYFANGGSCDWMYGDTSHSKIISFTPEVGFAGDGFWPAPSRIVPLCEENIAPNLFLAKYAVNGLDVINKDTTYAYEFNFSINLKYLSTRLDNNKSIKSYLDFYNNPLVITNLDTFTSNGLQTFAEVPFSYAIITNFSGTKNIIPYRVVSIIDGIAQYDSAVLVLDKPVGILKNNRNKEIKIYPNPSSTRINIDYPLEKNSSIKIYSISGQLISEHHQNTIDISNLSPGIYFVSIKKDNVIIAIESFRKM